MSMTATRRDLIRLIVELVHATQTLARATEENTRVSRSLRADIARMSRRARSRRSGRPRRSSRRAEPAAGGAPRLRLVSSARAEGREAQPRRRRAAMPEAAGQPSVAATHAPPQP
jgi:hypothetical protein